MNIDELQQAWQDLNERVTRNELMQKQQIVDMLTRQKENGLHKIYRLEKTGLVFFCGITLFTAVKIICANANIIFWFVGVMPLVIAVIFSSMSFLKIRKITKETNLERQIINVLQYKSIINYGYITGYLSVIPLIVLIYFYYNAYWNILLLCAVVICFIIDYFVFHFISDKVKGLSQINRELTELSCDDK